MMGDTGGERVWSFLGARHGRLGSVGSHTDRFIYIAMVEEFSKAGGSVGAHLTLSLQEKSSVFKVGKCSSCRSLIT